MTQTLHRARARLGLAGVPSLDATRAPRRDAIGVGAAAPGSLLANLTALRGRAPAITAVARPAAVATVQWTPGTPLHISERHEWAKIYMAIEIPVDSTETEPTGILPGATLQIKAASQVTVWITDFTVDTDEPSDFVITQFKISRVDLVGGSGGIPASRFRQNSRRPQLNNEILNGGSFALIEVKNINKNQTLDFHASMEGLDMSKPMAQSL